MLTRLSKAGNAPANSTSGFHLSRGPLLASFLGLIASTESAIRTNSVAAQSASLMLVIFFTGWIVTRCLQRSLREPAHRVSWSLLALGIVTGACAHMIRWMTGLGWISVGRVPIVGILGVAFYPIVVCALGRFVRVERHNVGADTWADGVVSGIGALTLLSAVMLGSLGNRMYNGPVASRFALAMPLCDVFLVVLVVAGYRAWRRTRSAVFLMGAVACLLVMNTLSVCFGDGLGPALGDRLNYFWFAAAACTGLLADEPSFPFGNRTRAGASNLTVPLTFSLAAVLLLIFDRFHAINRVALVLCGMTLTAAAARAGLAVRELRTLSQTRREARTDELTQLPNRRCFSEMIEQAVSSAAQEGQPLAVLMVDLDGFKVVNDTLGHHTGDELLREVARRFAASLAPGDMLARLGGDEFGIVVLPREHRGWSQEAGERLVASLLDRMELDGVPIQVRASVGAALYPDHGDTPSLLLQRADIAMYEAKRSGGGVKGYEQGFDRNSREQLQHLEELRHAIELDQLVLYYQPKVRFVDGHLSGVEALVRWNHPTRGMLSPREFLPLATQGGLLPKVTRRVLSIAVEQAGVWHAYGRSLGVSVNVGSVDVVDSTFPSFVEELLTLHRLPAALLTIEITEDSVIEDPVRTANVVARLRKLGTRVSIDDFGAGYASLSLLRKLDLDELKLDKSLVDEIATSSRQKALVRAAVGLAHALGLSLVAEGVETADAWRELQLLDCDVAQGYLVSRPLSPADLDDWLQLHRQRPVSNQAESRLSRPFSLPLPLADATCSSISTFGRQISVPTHEWASLATAIAGELSPVSRSGS